MPNPRNSNKRKTKRASHRSLPVPKSESCFVKVPVKDNYVTVIISLHGEYKVAEMPLGKFLNHRYGWLSFTETVRKELNIL